MVKSFNQTSTTGYSSFYKYDAAGRLTEVLVQNPGSGTEILLRYQYDQNGNVTRIDDDLAQKYVLYTYDELSQLTKEEYWTIGGQAADTTIQYSYDELGNRTSVNRNGSTTSYSYNTEKNRLTAVGGVSYTYDEAGNLKNDGTRTYSWNEANQLWQVTSGANTYSFTYDALGRRISKNVNGTVEYYHYDGDRVSYVTNSAGAVLHRFTYDQSGRPVFMGANSTLYYYHYNAHGDVIKLTDLAGNVAAEYTYDAWGNITSQTGVLAGANPYRYAGYWYDQETGLYFLNARYYKPDVGRFVAQDSWGGLKSRPTTQNRYSYAVNNPVNYVDPSGRIAVPVYLAYAAVAAGIGLLATLPPVQRAIEKLAQAGGELVASAIGAVAGVFRASSDENADSPAEQGQDQEAPNVWSPPTQQELENEWDDVTDPRNKSGGRDFVNPKTGEKIRLDPGKPDAPGKWEKQDHYHKYNPDPRTSRKYEYLDKLGNPVRRRSDASHIPAPWETVPKPPK